MFMLLFCSFPLFLLSDGSGGRRWEEEVWEADEERAFFRGAELVCNDYLSQINMMKQHVLGKSF